MEHGEVTLHSPVELFGPPHRRIGMWSIAAEKLGEIQDRAIECGAEILTPPTMVTIPFLGAGEKMLLRDPGGFPIEVFETA